ncbi:response regulator [Paenibacillus sp. N3.4]|uniref:response regulator transcription factor n=1 Tax=Paenibacillus sp. N3.4 TaxID=2603222 RepID=UPI0011CB645F|nr:response regulator [Paenibacillus sp. N3.4]TXK84655.1 response regulator [Paenibacillus sp. N3.4]
MKVLIVDDEEHVREGIDLSVDWEAYGVTEKYMAANGLEALELISLHKPDVMFCDMKMPVMGGTELLERIREEGWNTQVIVISGYNDYVYTRATIKANGVDYILKPFRRQEVEEAFRKAVSAWRMQVESRKEEVEKAYLVKKADALLDEKKLAAYFRNEILLTDSVRRIFTKTGIMQDNFECSILVPRNMTYVLNQRFMKDDDLFLFAVDNIARDALSGQAVHHICRLDAYQWVLLISFPRLGAGRADVKFYLERLKRAWEQTIGLHVLIGASSRSVALTDVHQAMWEAQNALLNTDIGKGTTSIVNTNPLPSLMNQELLLREAIETGNLSFASTIIDQHMEALRRRGTLLLKELQGCTMEANLLLGRYSQKLSSNKGTVQGPLISMWVCDIEEWERIFAAQMMLLIGKVEAPPMSGIGIQDIRAYLDSHYHENISLKSLTEQFHFSPQYISKKFSDTYQTTIVAYITHLKIERAKVLLTNTSLSVYEISSRIGYEDENYFSKVFKKQAGLSPLQYRKEASIK